MTEGERQTEGRDKEREREGEILQRWRDSRRERWLDRQTRRREIKCKRERTEGKAGRKKKFTVCRR